MKKSTVKCQYNILDCVGNTPMVRLERIFSDSSIQFYGKLEMFNPGGSVKDRTALRIIQQAMIRGDISRETCIIESTSGNMGIGLARVCHYYGMKLILVTDLHINEMTVCILKAFGAKVVKVDEHDGNGGYLNSRLSKVQSLLNEIPNSYWPDQYHNMDNPKAHEETYLEIVEALGTEPPDYIFISTSTCGTLTGFGDAIAKYGAKTKLIAVDAAGSVIFDDNPRARLIPGMGASRKSDFLKRDQVSKVVHVTDQQSVEGCHMLLASESIMAGGSSGAVVKAVEYSLNTIPADAIVVAIMADNGERYLSTIYNENWISNTFNS